MKMPNCHQLFQQITEELIKNNITLKLYGKRYLKGGWSGEFRPDTKELICATGRPMKAWFPVFLHEYCHYLQWKEQSQIWESAEKNSSYDVFFEWVEGEPNKKITKKELRLHCNNIKNVEYDCERRVLKLIDQFDLEIDKPKYIQQSNAYVASYDLVLQNRKFPKKFKKEYIDSMSNDRLYKKLQNKTQVRFGLKCFD